MMGFVKVLAIVVALSGVLGAAHFDSDPTNAIEGEYIVVLHNATAGEREHLVAQVVSLGGEILHVYTTVLSGFSARLGSVEEKILPFLLEHSLVESVERNRVVKATDDACITQQTSTPWGLSRISHVGSMSADAFTYNPSVGGDGAGVVAYIIDTGIQVSHVEFEGRAEEGFNAFATSNPDEPATDCNGHGTHVAGTIGGVRVGVAKASTLIAVKTLDCAGSGAYSGVIAGVDYSVQDCQSRGTNLCVANLSLGGIKSPALNSAVDSAVDGGVVMVVAAGNEDTRACLKSPASAEKAISVGATELDVHGDDRSYFSNYGKCVDLFAPGSAIESAWIDEAGLPANEVYATISGTSMASPHAAGVVAQHIANLGANSPPASGYLAILTDSAESGVIDLKCDGNSACLESPNLMLQSLTC